LGTEAAGQRRLQQSFHCKCRFDLQIVEGTRFIQLEHRGLHHINSHMSRHMMISETSSMSSNKEGMTSNDEDEVLEITYESDN
jgi:hypothetical protein